jgi:hypothetical protein
MGDLRRIQDVNWDEIEALEMRLLREMTEEQSLRDYLALQSEFEPLLKETEALYRPEREAALIRLQERLLKFQERQGNPMERLAESLLKLQELLAEAGIPSAAIGGVATGVWGEPRLTRDVDLKILLTRESRQQLLDLLATDYLPLYPNPDEQLRRNGVMFVRDSFGTRIDLLLADTDYDDSLIARAREIELLPGRKGRVCSPEDLVVLKLIASRPIDMKDAESVIQRQGEKLGETYILEWLTKFEKMLDDSTFLREYTRMRDKARRLSGLGGA